MGDKDGDAVDKQADGTRLPYLVRKHAQCGGEALSVARGDVVMWVVDIGK
jgi:hypothetical protein